MAQSVAVRSIFHTLLTITMYAGICIFLFPYLSGKSSTLGLFVLGAAVTVTAGIFRCRFTEDGCGRGHQPHRQH